MPDSLPEPFDRAMIGRWLGGWARSRSVPPPEQVGDVFQVELGLPGRAVEYFPADAAEVTIAHAVADAIGGVGPAWVSVVTTDPDAAADALRRAGLRVDSPTEYFMGIELTRHPLAAMPAPYRLELREDRHVLVATITDLLGGTAASGRLGLSGLDAVPDKIETSPQHRRRGLGAAMMSALAAAAVERGSRTGILTASAVGERLYRRLGWTPLARLVIGRTHAS